MKKLGFGFMRLPILKEGDFTSINMPLVKDMVDLFMKKGFTYFDTAYPYHGEKSEEALREALVKRYPRNSFILADKMPTIRVKEPNDYEKLFNVQLKRCGVEYFDRYLLHNIWKNSYRDTLKFGGFEFMQQKIKEGKIKKFGFSFHDEPELLDEILKNHPEVEFVQLQINYHDWDSPSVRSRECYETARKYNKEIIIMEPNKGGSLINLPEKALELLKNYNDKLSAANRAMRFAGSLEGVSVVLSGMSNMEQLIDNISFMDNFITFCDEEYRIVKEVSNIISESAAIECTKCRYCTEVCPEGIPIPEYFDTYNSYMLTHNMGNTGMYYRRYANGRKKASECIKCGKCEKACPQHLKIREILKKVSDVFEI